MPSLFLVMAALGLVWPVLAFSAMRRASLLHPAKLYALLFALHIAMPSMLLALGFAPSFVNAANLPYLLRGVLFSWICLLAIWLGALAGSRLRFGGPPMAATNRSYTWRSNRAYGAVLLLLLVGWITKAYVIQSDAYLQIHRAVQGELEGPLYALIRMLEVFSLHGVVMLIAFLADRHRRGQPVSMRARRLAALLVIAEFAYWLPTGRKEDTILSLLLPLATLHLLTGYVPPRKAIAGMAVFVTLLFPATHYYRLAVESNITSLGVVDSQSLLSLAEVTATSGDEAIAPTSIVFNRVSMLEPISACIRLIDEGIWEPFIGESYAMLLISLVPRVIWPDKPLFDYGQEFGRVSGFLGVDDDSTSISVTYIGESYLNFGWLGWVPMFGIALFFAALYKRTKVAEDRATWTLLYVISLPSLLYFGGTFATYFGGLLKILPFFFLICSGIRRREVIE